MRRRSSRRRPRYEAVGSSHTGSTFDRPLLDPAVPLACWHGPAKCIGRAFWAPANQIMPDLGWSFRLIVDPPKSWRRSCFWRSVIEPGKAPALVRTRLSAGGRWIRTSGTADDARLLADLYAHNASRQMRQKGSSDQAVACLRRLGVGVVGSAAVCAFRFRPPGTGSKRAGWRRSGAIFAFLGTMMRFF